MSRPLVLSASSVNAWLDCNYRWYLTYVERRPETGSVKAAIGIAVHEGAELLLRAKMGGPAATVEDAAEAVRLSLGMALPGCRPDPDYDGPAAIRKAEAALRVFERDILPTAHPEAVEVPFQVLVDDAILYSGIIDWIDDGTHDLKTTKSRPSPSKDRYWHHMIGYTMGRRELTGTDEVHRTLDFIVLTQKPYHWPVVSGPVTDDEVDRWAAQLVEVAAGIAAAEWLPTGLDSPWVCRYCPHSDTCEPYGALRAQAEGENDDE